MFFDLVVPSRAYFVDKSLFKKAEAVRFRDCLCCPLVINFEMGKTSKGL